MMSVGILCAVLATRINNIKKVQLKQNCTFLYFVLSECQ